MQPLRITVQTCSSWEASEAFISDWFDMMPDCTRPDMEARFKWGDGVGKSLYIVTARLEGDLIAVWPCEVHEGSPAILRPLADDLGLTVMPFAGGGMMDDLMAAMYPFLASAGEVVELRGVERDSALERLIRQDPRRPYFAKGDRYVIASKSGGIETVRRAKRPSLRAMFMPWLKPRHALIPA